jgi:phage-related protein
MAGGCVVVFIDFLARQTHLYPLLAQGFCELGWYEDALNYLRVANAFGLIIFLGKQVDALERLW